MEYEELIDSICPETADGRHVLDEEEVAGSGERYLYCEECGAEAEYPTPRQLRDLAILASI